MIPYLTLINFIGWFRVDRLEEEVGLDISHHKGAAYDLTGPDAKTMEMYDLHRSQHKLEVPLEDAKGSAPEAASEPVKETESDAGYRNFCSSVGVSAP